MINSNTINDVRLFKVTFKDDYGTEETYPIYDVSIAAAIKHVHQIVGKPIRVSYVQDPRLMLR